VAAGGRPAGGRDFDRAGHGGAVEMMNAWSFWLKIYLFSLGCADEPTFYSSRIDGALQPLRVNINE